MSLSRGSLFPSSLLAAAMILTVPHGAAFGADSAGELLARAVRLRELVEASAADSAQPVSMHPLYVPRSAFERESAGEELPLYRSPLRAWPPEAHREDPDHLRRMDAQKPTPEELARWIAAAATAPGESGARPAGADRVARTRLDAPMGAGPDAWTPLFFDVDTGARQYAGRVTQLARAHDPIQDRNVLWAGTVGGGLYKVLFVFPFAFWVPVSYPLAGSPSVGAFLVRPSNGEEILVGTGDFLRGIAGTGVYKTTDGGVTWTKKPLPAESSAIFRIAADSLNDAHVLLASGQGLFRSTSFGNGWATSIAAATVTDVIQDPVTPNYWYAAVWGQGVLESSDNGDSFHPFGAGCTPIPGPFGRAELAISPSAANYVYAVVENQAGGLNGIYRSADYGCHWTAIDPMDTNSWGQAFHALAIEVDPTTPSRLFVGMGGGQWTANATATSPCWVRNVGGPSDCGISYAFDAGHADLTDFLFNGSSVLIANDGGAFTYEYGTNTVEDLGNELGFVTLQTMTGLQALTSAWQDTDLLMAGLQDNGNVRVLANNGVSFAGGDGGIISISPDNNDRYYASFGLPYRRAGWHDDTIGYFPLNCGLANSGFDGVMQDPTPGLSANDVFLFTIAPDGSDDPFVWYKPPTSTCDWQKAHTAPLPLAPIAIDQANDPASWTLYAWAWNDHRVLVSSGAPGAMTWTPRTPPGVDPTGADMRLFADRNSGRAGTAYYTTAISQPQHAFVTHNKGLSWREVTGNLPYITGSTSLFEMAGDPHTLDTLFVATEVGVFRTDTAQDAFPIWYRYMEGLPAVTRAFNLDVRSTGPSSGVVRVGTYGHGFWERTIAPTAFIFADGFEAGSLVAWSNHLP